MIVLEVLVQWQCDGTVWWYKVFKEGREEVEDKSRSGCSSTSKTEDNVNCVHKILNCDRRLSVRMIAQTLGMDKTTVNEMVTQDLQT